MDALLQWLEDGYADMAYDGVDLVADAGLHTAVLISLFSDCKVDKSEIQPGDSPDLRGWWADAFAENADDLIGSKLWLLHRRKRTLQTLIDAESFAEESLAWLLQDGVAKSVSATAEWQGNALVLTTAIVRPNGDSIEYRFRATWEAT